MNFYIFGKTFLFQVIRNDSAGHKHRTELLLLSQLPAQDSHLSLQKTITSRAQLAVIC